MGILGCVVASLPGKTVREGAHRDGFGDLFLLYVLKTSSVQSLPLVLMLSSFTFGCVLQESSVNYMSQGSLLCE